MEVPCSGQQCFQHLSEFQKQVDAAQTSYQQHLKNPNNVDMHVNSINFASFKLEWLFEKVNIFLMARQQQ